MRLEQSFEVPVPVGQAWSVLLDIERIAPCMPGATLTDFDGEKFTGVVKVKLGPVQLSYRGSGRFVERDEPNRRVVITAAGQDNRGGGGAQAKITAQLREGDSGATTQVNVVADHRHRRPRGPVRPRDDRRRQQQACEAVRRLSRADDRRARGGGPHPLPNPHRLPEAAPAAETVAAAPMPPPVAETDAAASSSDPDAATGGRDRGHSARRAGVRGRRLRRLRPWSRSRPAVPDGTSRSRGTSRSGGTGRSSCTRGGGPRAGSGGAVTAGPGGGRADRPARGDGRQGYRPARGALPDRPGPHRRGCDRLGCRHLTRRDVAGVPQVNPSMPAALCQQTARSQSSPRSSAASPASCWAYG